MGKIVGHCTVGWQVNEAQMAGPKARRGGGARALRTWRRRRRLRQLMTMRRSRISAAILCLLPRWPPYGARIAGGFFISLCDYYFSSIVSLSSVEDPP